MSASLAALLMGFALQATEPFVAPFMDYSAPHSLRVVGEYKCFDDAIRIVISASPAITVEEFSRGDRSATKEELDRWNASLAGIAVFENMSVGCGSEAGYQAVTIWGQRAFLLPERDRILARWTPTVFDLTDISDPD